MAAVAFKFFPPDQEDLVKLHILEAPASLGPFNEIEVVTEIGAYPGYIDHYTTNLAVSSTDWFALQWEDAKGALSDISSPIRGDTETLISKVVSRVMQRDLSLDEEIVRQEAEAVIEEYVGDPYTTDASAVSYRTLLGLVYLTMANCYVLGGFNDESSIQIGLLRMQQGTSASSDVDALINLANSYLGISTSRVLQTTSVYQRHCLHEVFGA